MIRSQVRDFNISYPISTMDDKALVPRSTSCMRLHVLAPKLPGFLQGNIILEFLHVKITLATIFNVIM
jgi:hypothetical protein